MLRSKFNIFKKNIILIGNLIIDFIFYEKKSPINKDYFCGEFDIGKKLRTRREELKITIAQISKDLNLKEDYIDLLEKNEIDLLASKIYLIGFVRSYCDLLEIEKNTADQYLKIITGASSKNHLVNLGYQENQNPSRKYLINTSIILLALYLFLMLYGKIAFHNFDLTNLIIQNFNHQESNNEL